MTEYFEDEVLYEYGVKFSFSRKEDASVPNDVLSLRLLKGEDESVQVDYYLRLPDGEEWWSINKAVMAGKELPFESHYQRRTDIDTGEAIVSAIFGTQANYFYHVEKFTFLLPMTTAIDASCNGGTSKIALIGDYRKDIWFKESILQGFLKKAKDMKVVDIEGACFDYADIDELEFQKTESNRFQQSKRGIRTGQP